LAALPGISLLFCDVSLENKSPAGVPDSLNLAKLIAAESSPGMVRNTLGSIQLSCLAASLDEIANKPDYREQMLAYKKQITAVFEEAGIHPMPGSSSAMVTAFHRPPEAEWRRLETALQRAGIRLYSSPEYLESRRLFQVATMGNFSSKQIDYLCNVVSEFH